MRPRWQVAASMLVLSAVHGCGGGAGGTSALTSAATPIDNTATLVMDSGPAQMDAINSLYTSVTVCSTINATQCQTIDHVLVDTGSTGFRVLAGALGNGVTVVQLAQETDVSGNAVVECTQFVDGYSWGSVKRATLKIAAETAADLPIQVIGDASFPSSLIPSACVNVPNAEEDTVSSFGANGILGISSFLQDCGPYCASGTQDGSVYSSCSMTSPSQCQPVTVALAQQVANPVAAFASDNNGVRINLPSVSRPGQATGTGTLVFGIGTQSDNGLGAASMYTLDPNYGTLVTVFNGVQLSQSFIDTGSNGYFFPDSAIPVCVDANAFFCPTGPTPLSAQFQGQNGATASVGFTVTNADQIPAADAVAPGLAGPAGSSTLQTFDWGLPFFFGRSVYVTFEGTTVNGNSGPAVAF